MTKVIAGKRGNGDGCKKKRIAAGCDYSVVQKGVNRLLES